MMMMVMMMMVMMMIMMAVMVMMMLMLMVIMMMMMIMAAASGCSWRLLAVAGIPTVADACYTMNRCSVSKITFGGFSALLRRRSTWTRYQTLYLRRKVGLLVRGVVLQMRSY